ncbi:hypothetical protein [Pseudacidovorax sp. NFM-22]|uniref:hypothetical protein n=1 Tax=Pseudacidovorax sp. NFM-22 TaxID=2744469 RepID=UPI001F23144D|nr:hypothetical protein [Pseudacidovorax sp. NFM-22]
MSNDAQPKYLLTSGLANPFKPGTEGHRFFAMDAAALDAGVAAWFGVTKVEPEQDILRDRMRAAVTAVIGHAALAPQTAATTVPATPEPCRPDILERLTYHQLERDDLTIDECVSYLNEHGWNDVRGRAEREMVMQILALLAAAPAPLERQGRTDVRDISQAAWELVLLAEKNGICVRIERLPLQPFAMGHACHDVEVWPSRHPVLNKEKAHA